MRRKLFTLAAGGSAGGCAAKGGVWGLTVGVDPFTASPGFIGPLFVRSAGGQTEFSWVETGYTTWAWVFPYPGRPPPTLAETCQRHACGFGWGVDLFGHRNAVIPHWFIVMVSLSLPTCWAIQRHRANRSARA